MRELQEMRLEIDEIDERLVKLLEERLKVCEEVAEYKVASGKKVLDKQREQEKLKTLYAMAGSEFNGHCIEELFSQIMAMSRKMQYQILAKRGMQEKYSFIAVDALKKENIKVVYQGVEGAYSHQAMIQYFGKEIEAFHVPTWKDAMEEVTEGNADYAVVPIENSSAGSVNDIYDLLVEYDTCIVAETFVKVEHALLGLKEAEISDIQTVYSHPQGLMQCAKFLEKYRQWQQISQPNTAGSALRVLKDNDKTQAAIASEIAGELYGLKVLKQHINDNVNNTTRFIIISKNKIYQREARKLSISFEIPHASGTLYNMLSHLIFNNLSMTKIESRPLEGRNWEYRFFVDLEGNLGDASVINALKGIAEEAIGFRILGNY